MKLSTVEMMNEMVAYANKGNKIIPMFFQPRNGTNATVSAAIRAAKKLGLLVEGGKDGCGKPYYVAPVKSATHQTTTVIQ